MTAPNVQGSIRRRLAILLTLGAAGLAVVVFFLIQSVAREIAQSSQDNILSASAISIIDSARIDTDGELSIDLPYSSLSMLDSVTDERAFYAIDLDEDFLTGYEMMPRPRPSVENSTAYTSATFLGSEIRVASVNRTISMDDRIAILTVSVAQTLNGLEQTLAQIRSGALTLGIGFFLVTAGLALVIARTAILPLRRLTESVSRRGPKDLRPVAAPVPLEMEPLVSSLNSLMQRLDTSLSRSEDFIAEAAHRLRTPLAIVRTRADVVLRRSETPQNREAVQDIIRAIDESSRAAGQLLDHAMVTFRADDLTRESLDLKTLAIDAIERIRPIAEMRDIDLRMDGGIDRNISGDQILILNALHNVLDNAVKYSSPESLITVSLSQDGTSASVSVSDQGQGFGKDVPTLMAKRFKRGDNTQNIVGSGLGLTIARDVVTAHGGTLTIENKKEGGACVSLFWPLQP